MFIKKYIMLLTAISMIRLCKTVICLLYSFSIVINHQIVIKLCMQDYSMKYYLFSRLSLNYLLVGT